MGALELQVDVSIGKAMLGHDVAPTGGHYSVLNPPDGGGSIAFRPAIHVNTVEQANRAFRRGEIEMHVEFLLCEPADG
jgi:hypothetical protein